MGKTIPDYSVIENPMGATIGEQALLITDIQNTLVICDATYAMLDAHGVEMDSPTRLSINIMFFNTWETYAGLVVKGVIDDPELLRVLNDNFVEQIDYIAESDLRIYTFDDVMTLYKKLGGTKGLDEYEEYKKSRMKEDSQ